MEMIWWHWDYFVCRSFETLKNVPSVHTRKALLQCTRCPKPASLQTRRIMVVVWTQFISNSPVQYFACDGVHFWCLQLWKRELTLTALERKESDLCRLKCWMSTIVLQCTKIGNSTPPRMTATWTLSRVWCLSLVVTDLPPTWAVWHLMFSDGVGPLFCPWEKKATLSVLSPCLSGQ